MPQRRVFVNKAKLVAKPRVVQKTAPARRLESQIMRKTFARLKARGVPQREIDLLISLRKRAIQFSAKGIALARKKTPDVVVQAQAGKAWEEFYQALSRYPLQ